VSDDWKASFEFFTTDRRRGLAKNSLELQKLQLTTSTLLKGFRAIIKKILFYCMLNRHKNDTAAKHLKNGSAVIALKD